MGGLIQPSPVAQERDTSRRTILIAIAVVVALAAGAAVMLRSQPKISPGPPPYAVKLKISGLKMSQAQNFVGATVTYIDGTLTNTGEKTVAHTTVQVTFKDLYGQIAQIENVPIKVLQTGGPYPDTVDLSVSPLPPHQSKPFRLIFEHLSAQWNQAYPELTITDVTAN
ncbi:MAG: DUF2393 family protein [Acidobacteria bacterium]|nr:DUF2393 family protein [Acidobacteriota bacterium]